MPPLTIIACGFTFCPGECDLALLRSKTNLLGPANFFALNWGIALGVWK